MAGLETQRPVVVLLCDERARATDLLERLRRIEADLVIQRFGGGLASVEGDRVRAVACDVAFSAAGKVDWIRGRLSEPWALGKPFYCVTRNDVARDLVQAQSLGAVATVAPEDLERVLLALLPAISGEAALQRAGEAFSSIFDGGRAGRPIEPSEVAACARFIKKALRDVGVRAMIDMIRSFDDRTHQHCMLVAALAGGFAMSLGFPVADTERLTAAALLHDVGKSRIPLAILNKPGRLTAQERRIMDTHPVVGFEMLRGLGHSDECLGVVRSHHEMLDGSGYPDGLVARQIPDLVRLTTICDIHAALIENRPYRAPMSGDEAFSVLEGMSAKLDQDLVRAFRTVAVEIDRSQAVLKRQA